MKVLWSWLCEMADLSQASPAEIAAAFDALGTPVEDTIRLGASLEGVVVAEVAGLRAHPDADRIQLVDVDAGDGPVQVCCGAFNMAVGDRVPLATVGTELPSGPQITRRKLRGQWSEGMLCSAAELDLAADHEGILVLDGDAAAVSLGTPLGTAMGLAPDICWELEINPNRPDAMAVAGLARDLAAHFEVPFALPEPSVHPSGDPAGDLTTVQVDDPAGCGRFVARVLTGVTVGESPPWMAERLSAVGMRPINALVDISNYVMVELGQPNHPYDLDRLAGRGLRVRRGREGERLVTLDGVARAVGPEDLLICDATDAPVGIAGLMGGADTEISPVTTTVMLEMAWFLPSAISRSSRRLGLRSEASARFEKGCDPEIIDRAADRFCELAVDICGATVAPGQVDVVGELWDRSPVRVRPDRVDALLGTDLGAEEMERLLEPIGFACTRADGPDGEAGLEVVIPPWRYDSAAEIDVVEEVARHHGYGRIPRRELTEPRVGGLTGAQRDRRSLRRLLSGLGLAEVQPPPFLAPGQLARCGLEPTGIGLLNPLVAEESVLRPALLPGLVAAVAHNHARRRFDVGLWEIGQVFGRPTAATGVLPDERQHLAVVLADRTAEAAVETWRIVASGLRLSQPTVTNEGIAGLHPTRGGRVRVDGVAIGTVGELDPDVLAAHDVDRPVAYLELDLGAALAGPRRPPVYRQMSRYPSSDVDLAFAVADEVSAEAVEATLAAGDPLVWWVRLFDVYRGAPVPEGSRSLAYTVRLQATDHTLTDAEVAEARSRLIEAVTTTHGATLRG